MMFDGVCIGLHVFPSDSLTKPPAPSSWVQVNPKIPAMNTWSVWCSACATRTLPHWMPWSVLGGTRAAVAVLWL